MKTTITRGRALALATSGAAVAAGFPAIVRAQTSTIRIAASSAATQAEGYFAEQLGIFKQFGISSTITTTGRGAETLEAVVRGDIDVASTTPEGVANAVLHNIPLKIIAVGTIFVEPAPVILAVAKDSTIKNASDLVNTTLGVNSLNDSQTLGVWQWMVNNKIDPTRVKIVEIPFASISAALQRKEIASGCLVEPFASAAKADTRAVPGVYNTLGRHWALGVWYAHADYIAKNPALVKQVVAALYATAKRVNANPASVEQLLVTYTKLPIETIRTIVQPVLAEKAERSCVEPQLQSAARFKVISRPVSYEEVMLA
jgi:NitT/TauT family transport system substrate-binding protein